MRLMNWKMKFARLWMTSNNHSRALDKRRTENMSL